MNAFDQRIAALLEPSLSDMGFRLVLVRFSSGTRGGKLLVMAEPQAPRPMTLDDCEQISRHISALLDVEDVISAAYTLEVSSPGIDRPLLTAADFERYKGFEAKAELVQPMNGRKRFRGVIERVEGGAVTLSMPEGTFELPIDQLQSARLVLTDALIDFTEQLYQPTQPVNQV